MRSSRCGRRARHDRGWRAPPSRARSSAPARIRRCFDLEVARERRLLGERDRVQYGVFSDRRQRHAARAAWSSSFRSRNVARSRPFRVRSARRARRATRAFPAGRHRFRGSRQEASGEQFGEVVEFHHQLRRRWTGTRRLSARKPPRERVSDSAIIAPDHRWHPIRDRSRPLDFHPPRRLAPAPARRRMRWPTCCPIPRGSLHARS